MKSKYTVRFKNVVKHMRKDYKRGKNNIWLIRRNKCVKLEGILPNNLYR